MAKESGLGDRLYVGAYDVSGDTQSIKECTGSVAVLDVTAIDKSAYERIHGLRQGKISWVSYFNPSAGQEHDAYKGLPTTDTVVTYGHGTTLGNPAASLIGKQINYDGDRGADGGFTFELEAQSNGYGLVWGQQGTAGKRTDTSATNGTSIDGSASTSFGWAMAYHLTAISATNVTIKVQDSDDNSSFSDVSGATSGSLTAVGSGLIVSSSSTATVRRYWRVATTGTSITSFTFVVNFLKNPDAALVLG